jgi:hypothetical protein
MKLGLGEILEKASQQKTRKDRAAVLQQHNSKALQDLIQYALHPAIVWDLPEGNPPYKPCPYLDQEGMLFKELRRLYLFVNNNGDRLKRTKLENLFIEILESIAPKDAELLLLVKERKLPKGLTPSVIEEAFPGLIPYEQDQEVPQE